jgi:hypothetical protein
VRRPNREESEELAALVRPVAREELASMLFEARIGPYRPSFVEIMASNGLVVSVKWNSDSVHQATDQISIALSASDTAILVLKLVKRSG